MNFNFDVEQGLVVALSTAALTFLAQIFAARWKMRGDQDVAQAAANSSMDKQARDFVIQVMNIQSQRITSLTAEIVTLTDSLRNEEQAHEETLRRVESHAISLRRLFNRALNLLQHILQSEEGSTERALAIQEAQEFIERTKSLPEWDEASNQLVFDLPGLKGDQN